MIHTFNRESYANLLAQYQPKIIETESENEAAMVAERTAFGIALALALEHRPNRTPEEDAFLELLVTLIEKFEDEHYQLNASTPQSILQHLMEAKNLKQSDLVGILGSSGVVTEIVNGTREISKAQAKALGEFFRLSHTLFL